MPKLLFQPPNEKNPIELNLPESYKRKVKAYESLYLKVVEPDFTEKAMLRHVAQKGIVNPDLVSTELLSIRLTKLKGNDFEDADGNIIRGPNAPRVALTYQLFERISDEKSVEMGNPPDAFPLSTDTFWEGVYKRPQAKIQTDERGNVVKSSVSGGFDCYYLEATPENIKSVLGKYTHHKNFRMTVTDDGISNLSVFNTDDFIHADIDDLAMSNRLGFVTKDGKQGAIERYHKYKIKLEQEGKQTALEAATTEPKSKKNVQQATT